MIHLRCIHEYAKGSLTLAQLWALRCLLFVLHEYIQIYVSFSLSISIYHSGIIVIYI